MTVLRWLGPILVSLAVWLALAPFGLGSVDVSPARTARVAGDRSSCAFAECKASPSVRAAGVQDRAPAPEADAWDADEEDGGEAWPTASNDDVLYATATVAVGPPGSTAAPVLDFDGLGPARGHARGTEYPPRAS